MKNSKSLQDALPVIADFFRLGVPRSVRFIEASGGPHLVVETDKGHYFVKQIGGSEGQTSTLKEAAYVKRLLSYGVSVTAYIFGRNDSVIFDDGGIKVTVQKWVFGSHPRVTVANALQAGILLGRMSLVPATALPARHGWFSAARVQQGLVRLRRDFCRDKDAKKILSAYTSCSVFVRDVLPNLPKSIIHTDMHPENVLFHDGRLVGAIDWEDATVGASMLDFASSAAYWCFDGEAVRPRVYKALYEGYSRERAFCELESDHLIDCMNYVGVAQSLWRYFQWGAGHSKGALWALRLGDYVAS